MSRHRDDHVGLDGMLAGELDPELATDFIHSTVEEDAVGSSEVHELEDVQLLATRGDLGGVKRVFIDYHQLA